MLKVDICCIARREEMSILDWVEYHFNAGINHIHIFDNNDVGDDSLSKLLRPYLDSGFVTVYDTYKGQKAKQVVCYKQFQERNFNEQLADYVMYIDCDEYVAVNDKYGNISQFLEEFETKCDNIGVIYMNWKLFTANKHFFWSPKPVVERFTELYPKAIPCDKHIKSIVKSTCRCYFRTPHNANPANRLFAYDTLGRKVGFSPFQDIRDDYPVYLNHYVTKSVQEYVYRKYGQGTADSIGLNYYNFDNFIGFNIDADYYVEAFNFFVKNKGQ